MPSIERAPHHRDRGNRTGAQRGFTLVELVLAIAIIGGSFMTLLYLRMSALQRAGDYNRARQLQQLAQEQLDEVAYGLVEDTDGTFEDRGQPEWMWEVEAVQVSTADPVLLECTITVTYPLNRDEEGEYRLSTWFFPQEEHHLLDVVGVVDEEGR